LFLARQTANAKCVACSQDHSSGAGKAANRRFVPPCDGLKSPPDLTAEHPSNSPEKYSIASSDISSVAFTPGIESRSRYAVEALLPATLFPIAKPLGDCAGYPQTQAFVGFLDCFQPVPVRSLLA
jgi:hypothetical protein